MINHNLCLHAQCLIQQIFVDRAQPCDIAHGIAIQRSNTGCGTAAKSPEIRQRRVTPQQLSVFHLIKLCNTDTVLISRNVLCNDIHSDFGKIEVRSDAGSRGDTGLIQYLPNHSHS